MLVNATFYDGCVEKACIDLGIVSVSQTDKQPAFNCGLGLLKTHLIEMWKSRDGVMAQKTPKYQPELPASEIEGPPPQPELQLCSFVDNCLVLPRDIRTEFLADPVRGPEWRKMVQEFDRCFASSIPRDSNPAETQESATAAAAADGQAFDWISLFSSEPRESAAWHEKYDGKVKAKCQWCPQLTAYLVDNNDAAEGEPVRFKLFVEASEEYTCPMTEPFLAYGAGTWILDAKADSYIEENPNGYKAVLCEFTSDTADVVLEAWCRKTVSIRKINKHSGCLIYEQTKHIYIHGYTYVSIYIYMFMYMHLCIYIYKYIQIFYLQMYIYINLDMYIYIYMDTCIHINIYL